MTKARRKRLDRLQGAFPEPRGTFLDTVGTALEYYPTAPDELPELAYVLLQHLARIYGTIDPATPADAWRNMWAAVRVPLRATQAWGGVPASYSGWATPERRRIFEISMKPMQLGAPK